jgi:DNA invertase Pin-like site-specific DNA recombinase
MSRLNNNLKITVFLKAVIKAMAEEIPAPSNNTYIFNKTEREKKIIELYFAQRKSIRDIATELRMSFATITNILNRYKESKEEQDALVYNIYHNNNGDNGGNGDARSKPTTNPQ